MEGRGNRTAGPLGAEALSGGREDTNKPGPGGAGTVGLQGGRPIWEMFQKQQTHLVERKIKEESGMTPKFLFW